MSKLILTHEVSGLGSAGDVVDVKNGYARNYSGVSLDSFVKKITFQRLSAAGLQALAPTVEVMAEAEGLRAHAQAVALRRLATASGGTEAAQDPQPTRAAPLNV